VHSKTLDGLLQAADHASKMEQQLSISLYCNQSQPEVGQRCKIKLICSLLAERLTLWQSSDKMKNKAVRALQL